MDDGYIAVRNYSYDVKELKTEQLKDWNSDFEKLITNDLNVFVDYPKCQFQPKSFIYYPARDVYLQVKKYDEPR